MVTMQVGDWAFIHDSDPTTVKMIAPWGDTFEIQFEVLAEFVGGIMRDRFIGRIEQVSGVTFLEKVVEAGGGGE